jgi:hypothetical protein
VDQVLAIQIGHLELIHREIEKAQEKLSGSFQELADQTAQLNSAWSQLQNLALGKGSSLNALEVFKLEVERLEGLQTQCGEVFHSARRNAERAAEASTTLARHVGELQLINRDIHMQALNAIVKAARLGQQGVTLSVLSMHVDWLYRESNQASAEIVSTLQTILGLAARDSGNSGAADQQASPDTGLKLRMERIESACDSCHEVSVAAAALADEQRALLASSGNLFGFLSDLSAAATGQIQELMTLRSELQAWALDAPPASPESLALMSERYTMQSERDVHLLASGDSNAIDSERPASSDTPLAGEIQLHAGSGKAMSQDAPAQSNFGDNVDLF